MVLYNLVLRGRADFVEAIELPIGAMWHMTLLCISCHENFPKQVTFSRLNEVDMTKEHGHANFMIGCKNCSKKGFILIDPKSSYRAEPDEDGVIKSVIATMECRCVQIISVNMGNMFTVKVAKSGRIFQNADFTDLWCQYDQTIDKVVQVEQPRIQIIRVK